MSDERKARLGFELLGRTAWKGEESWATADIQFWSYYGERGALTIVEGNHTEEQNNDIVFRGDHKRQNEKSENCSNCTKYISFTCRASALVELAKTILKTYDPNYPLKE